MENGQTFDENARIKAEYYYSLLGGDAKVAVIAEDSGMEIDALSKTPGIHSRRCNGTKMSDE